MDEWPSVSPEIAVVDRSADLRGEHQVELRPTDGIFVGVPTQVLFRRAPVAAGVCPRRHGITDPFVVLGQI